MLRLLRIAAREYLSYVKTPGFWLSLLIAPGMGAFSSYVPIMAERSAPVRTLAVVDFAQAGGPFAHALHAGAPARAVRIVAPPPPVASSATPDQARAALQPYLSGDRALPDGDKLSAAVILTGSADRLSVDLWSRQIGDLTMNAMVGQAAAQVVRTERLTELGLDPAKVAAVEGARATVHEFSPKAASGGRVTLGDQLPAYAALAMSFLLWMLVITGSTILLSSVIEEKSNRVLELLMTSASVPEILGGKILGVAMLAGTMLVIWAGVGYFALQKMATPALTHQVLEAVLGRGLLPAFLAFFVLGYLMYAAIFVAVGSFCETPREAQTLVGPIMILLILPIMLLASMIRRPDNPLLQYLAWFPPFTPFLMISRTAAGAAWWEIAGTLAMMVATTALVVWISARAFRAGALSTAKFDLQLFFQGIRSAGR